MDRRFTMDRIQIKYFVDLEARVRRLENQLRITVSFMDRMYDALDGHWVSDLNEIETDWNRGYYHNDVTGEMAEIFDKEEG